MSDAGSVFIYNMIRGQGLTLTVNDAANIFSFDPLDFKTGLKSDHSLMRSSNPSIPYQDPVFGLQNRITVRLNGGRTFTVEPTVDLTQSRITQDLLLIVYYDSVSVVHEDGTQTIFPLSS